MDDDNIATCARVVHLLDGPFVTVGDRRTDVPEGSKRLLAFVALHDGRVERRFAAGSLWPDGDDLRASGNLRSALWRLRRVGIDVVRADKASLALCEGVRVDIREVGHWATTVLNGRAAIDGEAVRHDYLTALELLPGWFDEWVIVERERLRQRVLHALEELSRSFTRRGRYGDSVEVALAAVSAEPFRESAQRVLIEAYLAEGNAVEAYRTYARYSTLLRSELDVAPSPDLAGLVASPSPDLTPPAHVRARPDARRLVGTKAYAG